MTWSGGSCAVCQGGVVVLHTGMLMDPLLANFDGSVLIKF
jgi:hypothetical protein